jgi:hypothetical protein
LSSGTVGMRNPLLHLLYRHLDHAGVGFLQQVADGLQCVRGKRREFGASLSQTQSDWQLIENRALLLRDERSCQAHCLDGRRSVSVTGSARDGNLDVAAADKRSAANRS